MASEHKGVVRKWPAIGLLHVVQPPAFFHSQRDMTRLVVSQSDVSWIQMCCGIVHLPLRRLFTRSRRKVEAHQNKLIFEGSNKERRFNSASRIVGRIALIEADSMVAFVLGSMTTSR
jgi:hypothetical protein